MLKVCDSITAPLEYLDFIVVSLDKSAGQPADKVVGDLIEPVFQGHQEAVKAPQSTFAHPFHPALDCHLRRFFALDSLKDRRQLLTQLIRSFQIRRTFKQQRQLFLLFLAQLLRITTEVNRPGIPRDSNS